jgi:hypothetical protein
VIKVETLEHETERNELYIRPVAIAKEAPLSALKHFFYHLLAFFLTEGLYPRR